MNQDEINAREWADPNNWHGRGSRGYFSRKDTRLWVPKRRGVGSTLNFAHRQAPIWFIGLLVCVPTLAILIKHIANYFGWLQIDSD